MSVPPFLRGKRGAFLALSGALAAALVFFVGPFVATLVAQQEDVAESKAQIDSAQLALARRPDFAAQFRALNASAAAAPGFLAAKTTALAQARLQSEMKAIIDANGGALMSAQILPPGKVRGLDVVAIQYDLTLPLSRLRSLLYAVETHTPYFFIDEADILMPPNWRSDNRQLPDPTLEIRWTVHAYRWSGTR